MAKVSVVIPVYNVEKYIKECLDSVKNQTLEEIEIICVDDGSTDRSGVILDQYAKEDSRFQVIHKKNEGYGKAINVGMEAVTSPYVGIVESDDWVSPAMYQKLYQIMEETKAEVSKADFYEFYQGMNGRIIEDYKPLAEGETTYLYHTPFSLYQYQEALYAPKYTWSGIYQTEFLRRERIFHNETPGASYQDNGFWFQTMVKAKTIVFVNQAFYHYRIDNMNSSIHSKGKVFAVCEEFAFIRKKLEEMGEEGNPYYKWVVRFCMTDCVGNIDRVAEEYRLMLAERSKEDFLAALQAGEVDAEIYLDQWKARIFEVLVNPKEYVKKVTEDRARLYHAVGSFSQVVIYGAGQVGQKVLNRLVEGRIRTVAKYFAVSEPSKNKSQVHGIPVVGIEELLPYQEEILVVLAVGENFMPEVEEKIKELGFPHYVAWKELW